MIYTNYNDLEKYVDSNKDFIELYSFDIFDTLIHRYVSPNCVLQALFKHISKFLFENLNIHVSEQVIAKNRHDAYIKVAGKYAKNGCDFEVDYNEFVKEWSKLILSNNKYIETLEGYIKNQEELLECSITYKSKYIFSLLDIAIQQGKPIVLISDMYLSKDTIEKILISCGYELDLFDKIYISSEYKFMKKTGKLFEKVISDYSNIDPGRIFHFGDNIQADGEMANRTGLNGIVIRDKDVFRKFEKKEVLHDEYLKNPNFIGRYISCLYKENFGDSEELRASIGSELLGPILSSFCHSVISSCQNEGIKNVYFCAREGVVLKEVFDRIKNTLNLDIESYYLYTSRLSSFQASMHRGISSYHIKNSLSNSNNYCLKSIFKPFGFDEEFLASRAEFYGIDSISKPLPIDFESWPPFINLINDEALNFKCKSLGEKANQKFIRYLNDIDFFSTDKVALVDVGWSGQIQNNIYNAVKDSSSITIYGYYFGTRAKAHETVTPRNKVYWIFGDETHLGWFGSPMLQEVFICETLTRACHPTVIGYVDNELKVIPKFKSNHDVSRVKEARFDPSLSVVQRYAVDYSQFYALISFMLLFSPDLTIRYARICLDRLVRFPTREMVTLFSNIDNVSDLGSNEVKSLLNGNVKFFEIGAIPRSLWPYAQSAFFSGIVSFPYFLKRAFNYNAKYPRMPIFENIEIIKKSNINPCSRTVKKPCASKVFREWNDIEELSKLELENNKIIGSVAVSRAFIIKTSSLYFLAKLIRKFFCRKKANYYNDAFSIKDILKTNWFE